MRQDLIILSLLALMFLTLVAALTTHHPVWYAQARKEYLDNFDK